MNLGNLIQAHGYWLLAVGCLLEGETILLLAGFAVHRGYLDPVAVVTIASTAGFLGDQTFFWLGRRHGAGIVARWPSVAQQTDRIHRLIDRYRAAVVIGVRFTYGLRIAGPVLIGMSTISSYQFGALNAVGAVAWACVIAGIGWAFGHAAEIVLGELKHIEAWLLLGLAAAAAVAWWVRRCMRH
jgi:membrane protein DedA with SNARE-associated domain